MLTRSPSSPASLSQRTLAQRRLRRTSAAPAAVQHERLRHVPRGGRRPLTSPSAPSAATPVAPWTSRAAVTALTPDRGRRRSWHDRRMSVDPHRGPRPSAGRGHQDPVVRKDADGVRSIGPTWESLTERIIREAQERGEFDDLPGHGRPLAVDENPYAGEMALAYPPAPQRPSVAPPWIEADKEARRLRDEVERVAAARAPRAPAASGPRSAGSWSASSRTTTRPSAGSTQRPPPCACIGGRSDATRRSPRSTRLPRRAAGTWPTRAPVTAVRDQRRTADARSYRAPTPMGAQLAAWGRVAAAGDPRPPHRGAARHRRGLRRGPGRVAPGRGGGPETGWAAQPAGEPRCRVTIGGPERVLPRRIARRPTMRHARSWRSSCATAPRGAPGPRSRRSAAAVPRHRSGRGSDRA